MLYSNAAVSSLSKYVFYSVKDFKFLSYGVRPTNASTALSFMPLLGSLKDNWSSTKL